MEDILRELLEGKIDIPTAKKKLRILNIKKIGEIARLDIDRAHRIDVPEAILAEGKCPEDVARLATEVAKENGYALITRVKNTGEIKKENSR
ncbi:MAG: hypothetical protein L6243_05020 [Candidatus Altiarchaeales archaeon]|nr:hypothetical protein [Candidatus Altiarchaeota archaeon]MBU4341887.1 hypothetical protein [Candidatus Altiarchaeota archaeon]MCG2782932.1 hypothetical protein [Candidatus Altiarchaeales archaeon]